MTDQNQKKQDDNQNTIDSVVTGVAEEVAMVGIAVAETITPKDETPKKK